MDNATLKELYSHVNTVLSDYLKSSRLDENELTLYVHIDTLERVITFLRDDTACRFEMLVDICGVDFPERDPRFEIVYHLLSITNNFRIRLKVLVEDGGAVPSITKIYSTASWFEREVWDLFGVYFSNQCGF